LERFQFVVETGHSSIVYAMQIKMKSNLNEERAAMREISEIKWMFGILPLQKNTVIVKPV
jgi:hypothetical protein